LGGDAGKRTVADGPGAAIGKTPDQSYPGKPTNLRWHHRPLLDPGDAKMRRSGSKSGSGRWSRWDEIGWVHYPEIGWSHSDEIRWVQSLEILQLRLLRRENPKWKYVEVRSCKYLNNIVEQDHRAIKRRCASMKGFKSFTNAAITIAGIELAHRIHKRQFSFGLGRPRRHCSLKVRWQRALA